MSDSHLSRPLCELAEESAGLISQLCQLMIREWTRSEWVQGTALEAFCRLASPDRLSLLKVTGLRLDGWAEHYKPAAERSRFAKRYAGFLELVGHFGTLLQPTSNPFSGPYFSPLQTSVVLLDDEQLALAKLAGTHLPETLRAWVLEMRQHGAKAQELTKEAAGGGDDEAYRELAKWAATNLKGKQRRAVELLAESNGRFPIRDLATDPAINWDAPYDNPFNGLRKAVNPKLRKIGWRLFRQDNEARIERVKNRSKMA